VAQHGLRRYDSFTRCRGCGSSEKGEGFFEAMRFAQELTAQYDSHELSVPREALVLNNELENLVDFLMKSAAQCLLNPECVLRAPINTV